MTTAAQVKRLLRPLLERNPDLVLVGRLVVVKPVRHILRSVFINSSSNKDRFAPYWALNMMFEHDAGHGPTWGRDIYPKIKGNWLLSAPGINEATCERIEDVALPILRPVNSIDDFTAFATKENFPHTWLDAFPYRRIYIDIARGDFKAANLICEQMAEKRHMSDFWSEEYDPILNDVWPLVRKRDKPTLARMLRQWEAEAAKRMKLEHIWEPTPFPLEIK